MKKNNEIIGLDKDFIKICENSIKLIKYARNHIIKSVNATQALTNFILGM